MKKTKRLLKRTKENGAVLITLALILFLVGLYIISDIIIYNNVQLREQNNWIAFKQAQSICFSTQSLIRRDFEAVIHERLEKDIEKRISLIKEGSFVCQEAIEPGEKLSSHSSICDPVRLLKNLPGAENQSIDELSVLKPSDPEKMNSPIWQEIVGESRNSYEYKLSTAYVGRELIQEAVAPFPRVDRYRWIVQADVISHTYDDIYYQAIINYDVVITVSAFDSNFQCSGPRIRGVNTYKPIAIAKCTEPSTKNPYEPGCNKVETCSPNDKCYIDICKDGNAGGPDKCIEKALSACGDTGGTGFILGCSLGNGIVYNGIQANNTFSSTSCKGGATNGGGYSWVTAIKMVGIGTNYD
jgi:hypothetical protein